MNKDEEVDADDLVSETDRTIRRDLEKFRRRLQGRAQLAAATGYKKIQTLASHFPLKFIVFTHENNWICPWVFSSQEICRKPTGQNIAGSFFESRNSKSVSQRWQHSIERDADLHVDIGCLKKRKIFYDRGKQIHIKTYRRF